MIPSKSPMSRTGSSRLLIILILPFPEVRETLFLKLLELRCLFLHPKEKHRSPRFLLLLRNTSRHHCLHCGHDPHVNVWGYLFPVMLYCQVYEDLVSSGSDHFTMWSKMSPHEIFAEHVVDIHKVVADFRDAFERNQSSSSQSYGVNKYFSSQSPVQKRLSICNWNPWPDVGGKTHSARSI